LYVKRVFLKNATVAAGRAAIDFCISFFGELSLVLQSLFPALLQKRQHTVTLKNAISCRIAAGILRLKKNLVSTQELWRVVRRETIRNGLPDINGQMEKHQLQMPLRKGHRHQTLAG
jgi:hypothetical protein